LKIPKVVYLWGLYMDCFKVNDFLSYFCMWSLYSLNFSSYATSIIFLGEVFLLVFVSNLFMWKVYEFCPASLTKTYYSFFACLERKKNPILCRPFYYIKNSIVHTSRNWPKCNYFICDYMWLLISCNLWTFL
jgi:hypothetical protein